MPVQDLPSIDGVRVAVVGLGYVGLPLAIEFGKHFETIGFDVKQPRIDALKRGYDETQEIESHEFDLAR